MYGDIVWWYSGLVLKFVERPSRLELCLDFILSAIVVVIIIDFKLVKKPVNLVYYFQYPIFKSEVHYH